MSSEEFEYFEDEEGDRRSSIDSDSDAGAESGIQPYHGEEDENRRLDNTDW